MSYKDWTVYADGYIDEWDDAITSGSYTGTRILWRSTHDQNFRNQVAVKLRIYNGRKDAVLTLEYFDFSKIIAQFKCTSIKNAVRKAEFRIRSIKEDLIHEAFRSIFQNRRDWNWHCAYKGKTPFCSFYYPSYEVSNGQGLESGEYIMVGPDHVWQKNISRSGYIGTGMKPSPEFPNWIKEAA